MPQVEHVDMFERARLQLTNWIGNYLPELTSSKGGNRHAHQGKRRVSQIAWEMAEKDCGMRLKDVKTVLESNNVFLSDCGALKKIFDELDEDGNGPVMDSLQRTLSIESTTVPHSHIEGTGF